MKKLFLASTILLLFTGCDIIESDTQGYEPNAIDIEQSINTSQTINILKINTHSNIINYTINLGSKNYDIDFVYTNTQNIQQLPTSSQSLKIASKQNIYDANIYKNSIKHFENNIKLPKLIKNTKSQKTLTSVPKKEKSVLNDQEIFYLDSEINSNKVTATLRKTLTKHSTTLNIWVDNNAYGANNSDCPEPKCVNDTMIEYIEKYFLARVVTDLYGNDTDNYNIYSLVTNILGDEWGPHSYENLINNTDTIDILLLDINNDNSLNGGVLGYFNPKDNFKKTGAGSIAGSNEKIMFYIDSNMLASTLDENGNDTDIWDAEYGYWPKIMISTLAHEFQHMISFYQKDTKQNLSTKPSTWFGEMMSEMTEDVVAADLNIPGPSNRIRYGYTNTNNKGGRIPVFNATMTDSLTGWKGDSIDYSTVYAFGAFLLRNYGGTTLLHNLMSRPHKDEEIMIQEAAGKAFVNLIQDCFTSVLLSNKKSPKVGFNYQTRDSWIFVPYNTISYLILSINFFDYSPKPNFNLTHEKDRHSSSIQKIATNVTGTFRTLIKKDPNTIIQILITKK